MAKDSGVSILKFPKKFAHVRESDGSPQLQKLNYQKDGNFIRPDSTFRNAVSRDPTSKFPAEKGRYALYVSPGCPWVIPSIESWQPISRFKQADEVYRHIAH